MEQVLRISFAATILHTAQCSIANNYGTTETPGFSRVEGKSVTFLGCLFQSVCLFCMRPALSGSIDCPDSHPFACGGGTKCTNSPYKPRNSTDPNCDGGVTDLYRDTAELTKCIRTLITTSGFRGRKPIIRGSTKFQNCASNHFLL